ncbi:MAG: dTMP kinase [Chloroflexi bacterium]|nr:dTMP kinase [Chloroflexota bacterium]
MRPADQPAGHFISIEGPDGAGKTLQARRLATALRTRGHDVVLTREPGGTPLGDEIREVLMATDGEPLDPIADALLFNAARAQHVANVIRPAVAAGRVVVCARYADSTLAYQGYGSGLDLDILRQVIAIATRGVVPDRTILLDLPAEAGLRRKTPVSHTRFETSFDVDFHLRVRAGFLEMAAADPARWLIVDADRDADEVFTSVLAAALNLVEAGRLHRLRGLRGEPSASVGGREGPPAGGLGRSERGLGSGDKLI